MKLVLAIIHDEDSQKLTTALNRARFQVTKLASTGGFLRVGNTTMLIGCRFLEKENGEPEEETAAFS